MALHTEIGKKGEEIAKEFLSDKGYKILELNWRHSRDEIDIICEIDTTIIFVEVKTRSTDYFGNPEESVTDKKQTLLIRAAEEYLIVNEIDSEFRFDIISVVLGHKQPQIIHIIDAFYPTIQE